MIVITAALFGALLGALRARAHGGSRLDMAQWAAASAIALSVLGLLLTIVLERSL